MDEKDISVIDWDDQEQMDRLHKAIEDMAKKLYNAGTMNNLGDENMFLSGVVGFYFALGKQDKVPIYTLSPGLCQDSAFGFDYYDPEHPLRHCKQCHDHPKMHRRRVVDPYEIALKVRPSRQKGLWVWTCPECHKDTD
jgi:hypothetical protein